jgi:hypothetical protein
LLQKLRNFRNLIFPHPTVACFSNSVRDRVLKQYSENKDIARTILVESQQAFSNQIALSFFVPELAQKHKAGINSYTMMRKGRFSNIKETVRNRNSIYYAFGAKKHLLIDGGKTGYWELYSQQIASKTQLEEFQLEGIRIGDLIYDTYLRRSKQPTLDLLDDYFIEIFDECVSYFYSFMLLFNAKKIQGVCVSHCVYHFAIPLRIAIKYGIEVFQVTAESVYRLSAENTHAYTNFKYYRTKFVEVEPRYSQIGLSRAKKSLEFRLDGNLSPDMPYSTKSAFQRISRDDTEIIAPSGRLKILVAIHDFFDSPHSYGDNFYPDFLVWLERLGDISNSTHYDWYIKTHRDPIANPDQILGQFLNKYPKFQILDKDIDHHTLIQQGIDIALTVYGTIGMEYPYLGVPVINASKNNPHVAYNFSLTPSSKEEYEEILKGLEYFEPKINLEEIVEYYFMAHIYELQSLFYIDYATYLENIGGYSNSIGVESLSYFLINTQERISDRNLILAMRNFISSKNYRLERIHYPNDCRLRHWEADE